MRPAYDVAVVGAAGADGAALLVALVERGFPLGRLVVLGNGDSVGTSVEVADRTVRVEDLTEFDFSRVQLVFFLLSAAEARVHVPRAVAARCLVIDHSSAFRYDDATPLVIASINPHALAECANRSVVAIPSAALFPLLLALSPLREAGIHRIVAELPEHQEAGAAAPSSSLSAGLGLGYTSQEMAVVLEVQKVLGDSFIGVNPTLRSAGTGGSMLALHIETQEKVTLAQAGELLSKSPDLALRGASSAGGPSGNTGSEDIRILRVREDLSSVNGLDLWIVADNVRRIVANNSVQIAEILTKSGA
ncbi:MAG: Asd/ArgC dimerization domain-containing protein [Pseudomonadota bacterium]